MSIEDLGRPHERQPWERLKEQESSRAYAAFCVYRSLDPRERSLKEAARLYYEKNSATNLAQLKRWSVKYRWVERSGLHDDFVDERRREKVLEQILASVKVPDLY